MWVSVTSTRSDDNQYKLNLGLALGIREYEDRFEVYYAGDSKPYGVKKTPDMVEAYNNLVPVKSQPVVPAEPEDVDEEEFRIYPGETDPNRVPFRITGFGLYETVDGETVHITEFDDSADDGVPWVSDKGCWYYHNGSLYAMPPSDGRHIVKLIKLDEVQP